MSRRLLCIASCFAFGVISCSDEPSSNAPDSGGVEDSGDIAVDTGVQPPPPAVTYFRDVKPIIDAKCAGCHVEGGIAPMPLTDFIAVSGWREQIAVEVDAGNMPPWHADDVCAEYKNDRSLSEPQRATLLEWVSLDGPEGEASAEGAPIENPDKGLVRVDRSLTVLGEYTPAVNDDYHCFVLDWPESSVKFVTGFNLAPSNRGIVHHANIYVAPPNLAPTFHGHQDNNPDSGYRCFGGVVENGVSLLGSWAPGSNGLTFPAGTGIQVEPGSVIVMELHFNFDGTEPGPDQSTLEVSLADRVEKRAFTAAIWNFFDWTQPGGMMIPAGESDVVHQFRFDPAPFLPLFAPWVSSSRLKIHAAGLHMHYLGSAGSLSVERAGGAGEECILRIPDWDFDWQTGYFLETPLDFVVGSDMFKLECHWDNTAENQPSVAGQPRAPRDVEWGGGSNDEMCIGFLYITEQ